MPLPPPPILISDYTTQPPVTTHYTHGRNTVALTTAYPLIKSLLLHPACTHRISSTTWPCNRCETNFTSLYWTCAATLLDYFSDFYPSDSPAMQAVWFHLLDIWQESATSLPYEVVLDYAQRLGAGPVWGVEQARRFEEDVRKTIDLFHIVVWGLRSGGGDGDVEIAVGSRGGAMGSEMADRLLYDPRGEAWCPVGEYETGPWVSGTKPWLQFLGIGGPGVAVRLATGSTLSDNDDDDSNIEADDDDDDDGLEMGSKAQDKDKNNHTITLTRYIPMPAIAIIKSHTDRIHTLASRLDTRNRRAAAIHNANNNFNNNTNTSTFLASVQQKSLAFPSVWTTEKHVYVSKLTGCKTTYLLRNGAPPIFRHAGFGDPNMVVIAPDWVLVDECVAISKNVLPYEAIGGPAEEEDEEEEEEEEEEEDGPGHGHGHDDGNGDGDGENEDVDDEAQESDDEEDVFDMWTVVESTEHLAGEKMSCQVRNEGSQVLDLGPMFDQWCELDELEEC